MRRLSCLDAGFLALETDLAPLHVGALLVLDGPAPNADMVLAELAHRASATVECRQRVRRSRGPCRPVWVDDPGFDSASHVHATCLRPPHDRTALRARVVELMGVRLDTSRPLWEAWLVDGLEDGSWAVLLKAHHTLLDGVAGAGLLAALLSPAAEAPARSPASPDPRRGPLRGRVHRLRQGARSVAVPDLPSNVLNGPLGARRTWDWVPADLADLHLVASRAGCSINDVYLAAVSGGLRTVLLEAGSLDAGARVRVLVPVSLRQGASDVRPGNLDAAFFVDLPVHAASAGQMLHSIAAETARAKAEEVPLATEQLLRAGDLVPVQLLDRAARAYVRHGQARVNLVASNVRGPGAPLAMCGSLVREIVPCLPLALDVRATCALLSYAGRAAISMTVDSAVVPDARLLAVAVAAFLDELVGSSR